MKSILSLIIAVLSLAIFSAPSFAKEKKAKDTPTTESYSTTPWGMGGCSLWNYAIKDKSQGPQIGVWVLEHIVFGVQTFAISSGTANCVSANRAMTQNEQEVFVNVNLVDLEKEAAQGKGQHLDTLAEIFGCNDKEGFAQLSQNHYEAIFTHEDPSTIVQTYKSEIKTAAASCSRAG
jgi:hypothetical protein